MDSRGRRLASAKRYLRAEGVEEDALILDLCQAAANYLKEAGVSEPEAGSQRDAQYQLVLNALVLSYYDTRGAEVVGGLAENPALRRALNQLKMTEPPVSNLDTGGGEG